MNLELSGRQGRYTSRLWFPDFGRNSQQRATRQCRFYRSWVASVRVRFLSSSRIVSMHLRRTGFTKRFLAIVIQVSLPPCRRNAALLNALFFYLILQKLCGCLTPLSIPVRYCSRKESATPDRPASGPPTRRGPIISRAFSFQ